jgi:phospholipid transport system substrate-binding protein
MPAKRLPLLLAVLTLGLAPLAAAPAHAATDPAASQIGSFDSALLDTMKQGASLGAKGRYHKLEPVIQRTFDLPAMAKFAVGPAWSKFTPAQQADVVDAFGKLTIASFARNFSGYGGEHFDVDANVVTRGPDKLVSTHLIRAHDTPVALLYRMRDSGGGWKVIDVYFNNISQLTTRRSDFAGPVASGGAAGLISHLNTLVANQQK